MAYKQQKHMGDAIRIQVTDLNLKNTRSYRSIYEFLSIIELGRKLKTDELDKIHNGEPLKIGSRYVFKFGLKSTIAKRVKQIEREKKLSEIKTDLDIIRETAEADCRQMIFILNNDFKVKEVFIGKTVDLATKENMTYTDLKSKLSRFEKFIKTFYRTDSLRKGSKGNDYKYAYATDYFKHFVKEK